MAVYKIFPSQDTTLYSAYPNMNTGIDPLLEISSTVPPICPSPRVARAIVQFDQSEINNVVDNVIGNLNSFSSSFKSFISTADGVNFNTTMEMYPISGSWFNGNGMYLDTIQNTKGCSWKWTDFSGSNAWPTSGFATLTTGSYSGSDNAGGGGWFTGSGGYSGVGSLEFTQSFTVRGKKDIDVNVTDALKVWYSSSKNLNTGLTDISNNGFILKWTDDIEFNSSLAIQPEYNFYSVDTNTIYPPQLEFKWSDFTYETGSLSVINTPDLFIGVDDNEGVFYSESINNFRLNVRPKFPIRTFQTESVYTENFALPTASYYAIKDLDTNEYVVDFDADYTKISCDASGSYFKVYMNGLQPERYYKILVQTTIKGNTIVVDDENYFKVTNG